MKVVHSETHVLLTFGTGVFKRAREEASLFSSGRKVLEDGGRRVASMVTSYASSHVPPLQSLRYPLLPDDVGGVPRTTR